MNADRFAPWYRWTEYAAFGRALERRRFAYLSRLKNARRILILGEGDGRALQRLQALAPHAELDVWELSAEMISLARPRTRESSLLRFSQQDIRTRTPPPNTYDGLVTFFFLDCFSEAELREVVSRLYAAMLPGGIWLVTDFALPEKGWRRWHARLWIWTMYRFFGLATGLRLRALPPIRRALQQAGMRCIESEEERAGLIRSEVWGKPLPDTMAGE